MAFVGEAKALFCGVVRRNRRRDEPSFVGPHHIKEAENLVATTIAFKGRS